MTLVDALDILRLRKKLPPNLGDLATNMLIFAICRRTRETGGIQHQTEVNICSPTAKQQHRDPQVESAMQSVSRRNCACDCLDILHWDANATVARTRGWESAIIFHLHLARLLILVPIRHIQRLASPQHLDNSGYKTSKDYVIQWARLDKYKARLSLVHAGALFWYTRRFSSRGLLEPFGVYAATLAIWAYSTYMHHTGREGTRTSAGSVDQPQFDSSVQQYEPSYSTKRPQNDEGDVDSQPTVIQLDRPCDDEIVQLYVRLDSEMSARMAGVGIIGQPSSPLRILKQGIRLLDGLEYKESSCRVDNLGGPAMIDFAWGISGSFSESLRSFVTAQRDPRQEVNCAEPCHSFS